MNIWKFTMALVWWLLLNDVGSANIGQCMDLKMIWTLWNYFKNLHSGTFSPIWSQSRKKKKKYFVLNGAVNHQISGKQLKYHFVTSKPLICIRIMHLVVTNVVVNNSTHNSLWKLENNILHSLNKNGAKFIAENAFGAHCMAKCCADQIVASGESVK